MILLVFAASVIVSVLLKRQARQHRFERTSECTRLGIPIPRPQPRLRRTEAWLNVGLGFILAIMAFGAVWGAFMQLQIAENFPEHAAELKPNFPLVIETGAAYLAGAVALVWLGWKALREITRFESGHTGE
jgi:hypothetical protein